VVDVSGPAAPAAPTVITMWAHPRAVSTAFLRMMIERGDTTVVHEPLVTLADFGKVQIEALPGAAAPGETVELDSVGAVLGHLRALGSHRPVFSKDTLEYRYAYLYEHSEELIDFHHVFIVRDPAKAIASHFAMKPTVACAEIGYEHQAELFDLMRATAAYEPLVISAERLVEDPAAVVSGFCERVGLPFVPGALQWEPQDRAEWRLTKQWHADATASSGFRAPEKQYANTVANNDLLRSYDQYHRPFYEHLIEYAL
jgi:hypothetical protein